jgi:hypothetical protein
LNVFVIGDAREITEGIVALKMGLDLHHFTPCAKTENTLDYFTEEDFADSPAFFDRHRHLLAEAEGIETEIIQVLYHTEKGYQRKGMNSEFYKVFVNGKAYVDKTDVIRAGRYLRTDGPLEQKASRTISGATFWITLLKGRAFFGAPGSEVKKQARFIGGIN